MVLGFFDGSMVNFAFMKTCPSIVVVVSSPLQLRFICLSISSGMAWPSDEPEIIDHSPCNWSRSFLIACSSAAETFEIASADNVRMQRKSFTNSFWFMLSLVTPLGRMNGVRSFTLDSQWREHLVLDPSSLWLPRRG